MDIHKPKPVHSLREFLSEILVVVCGILIAIGLEQAVETLHWAETVHEAKSSIHTDLVLASVLIQERLAHEACADAYLDALASAVASSPAQWRPRPADYCGFHHAAVYATLIRPWPTEVWRSIEAAGEAPHFDPHYRQQAPFTFGFISALGALTQEERRLATELGPLSYPIALTPDGKLSLLKTIAALRAMNRQAATTARDTLGNIRDLGEASTEDELAAMRKEVPDLFLRPGVVTGRRPIANP